MLCPQCSKKTKVIDSKQSTFKTVWRRRRECTNCFYQFTTYEFTKGNRHAIDCLNIDLRKMVQKRLTEIIDEFF